MIKKSIAYYTRERQTLSLGNLMLNSGFFVEDIFDAVTDAENFEQLTVYLKKIIGQPLTVDRQEVNYIRYLVDDPFGNVDYLKIKIKEN